MNRGRHVLLAALVISVPLLSGCTTPPDLPDLDSTIGLLAASKSQNYTWARPVATDGHGEALPDAVPTYWARHIQQMMPFQGAGPSLAAADDGALYATLFDRVLRSRDQGRTWDVVYTLEDSLLSGQLDRFITLGATMSRDDITGRLLVHHVLPGLQGRSPLNCNRLLLSDDGETWMESLSTRYPASCAEPASGLGIAIGPHRIIAAAPGPGHVADPPTSGYPNLVTDCVSLSLVIRGFAIPQCWISHDGGQTFTEGGVITGATVLGCSATSLGRPAVAPDGTIVLPLFSGVEGSSTTCPLRVAVSADNGLTWTTRTLEGDELVNTELEPQAALTPDGTAYVTYRGEDTMVRLIRSRDGFATFDGPWILNRPGQTLNRMNALVAGSDGRLSVAYLGSSTPQDPLAQQVNPNTLWHLFVATSHDAGDDDPRFIIEQVTPLEDPIQMGCVSYIQPSPLEAESGCDNLLNAMQADIDAAGRLYVGFTDGCTPRNACTRDAGSAWVHSESHAAVAVQEAGLSLLVEKGVLPALGLAPPEQVE